MDFVEFFLEVENALDMAKSGDNRGAEAHLLDIEQYVPNKRVDYDSLVKDIIDSINFRRDADNIRYQWDDLGARPGCDCGCGGDTFDWEGQYEALQQADELDNEASILEDRANRLWEGF